MVEQTTRFPNFWEETIKEVARKVGNTPESVMRILLTGIKTNPISIEEAHGNYLKYKDYPETDVAEVLESFCYKEARRAEELDSLVSMVAIREYYIPGSDCAKTIEQMIHDLKMNLIRSTETRGGAKYAKYLILSEFKSKKDKYWRYSMNRYIRFGNLDIKNSFDANELWGIFIEYESLPYKECKLVAKSAFSKWLCIIRKQVIIKALTTRQYEEMYKKRYEKIEKSCNNPGFSEEISRIVVYLVDTASDFKDDLLSFYANRCHRPEVRELILNKWLSFITDRGQARYAHGICRGDLPKVTKMVLKIWEDFVIDDISNSSSEDDASLIYNEGPKTPDTKQAYVYKLCSIHQQYLEQEEPLF